MNKLIGLLVLLAALSFIGAIVAKLVPGVTFWASSICAYGLVTPNSFLRLTDSSALLAIALSAVVWLKAKKE